MYTLVAPPLVSPDLLRLGIGMMPQTFARWGELSGDPLYALVGPGCAFNGAPLPFHNHNSPDHGLRRRKWAPRGPQKALRAALTCRADRGQPPEQANVLFVGVYGQWPSKCSYVAATHHRRNIGAF